MQNKKTTYIVGRSLKHSFTLSVIRSEKLTFLMGELNYRVFLFTRAQNKNETYIEGRSLTHPFTLFVIRTEKLTFLVGELNYRNFFIHPH